MKEDADPLALPQAAESGSASSCFSQGMFERG